MSQPRLLWSLCSLGVKKIKTPGSPWLSLAADRVLWCLRWGCLQCATRYLLRGGGSGSEFDMVVKELNGSSFFPRSEADFHVWYDASGSFGCGAVLDCIAMFQLAWPVSVDCQCRSLS